MRATRLLAAAALAALASSCSILGADSLAVSAWSPSDAVVADPAAIQVWVEFSAPPSRPSAERAFSLKANGAMMEGRFIWDGLRMGFVPFDGFERGVSYLMSVSTDAEAENGASLGLPFESRFETRVEAERPRVESTLPADGGVLDNAAPEIVVNFSELMGYDRFLAAVTLSPSVRGMWTHDDSGGYSAFTFHPVESYTEYEYRLTLDSSLADPNGNELAEDFSASFFLYLDRDPPELASASLIHNSASVPIAEDVLDDGVITANPGMDTDDGLEFVFAEDIQLESFKNAFSVEPAMPVEYETSGEFVSAVRLRFGQSLSWGKRYTVRIKAGLADRYGNKTDSERLWYLDVDGEATRPPEPLLAAFKKQKDAGGYVEGTVLTAGTEFDTLLISGYVEYFDPHQAYVDLYFRTAPGGRVDIFTLMQALSFSAYGSGGSATSVKVTSMAHLDMSTLAIEDLDLIRAALADPALTDVSAVRVNVNFTAGAVGNVVQVQVSSGLADEDGNTRASDWSLAATLVH